MIDCRDNIQWIVQRRDGANWRGLSFCRTRVVLIRDAKRRLGNELPKVIIANTAPMVAMSRAKAAIAHSMKMSDDLLKSNSLDGDDRLTTHETCCLLIAVRMQVAESRTYSG